MTYARMLVMVLCLWSGDPFALEIHRCVGASGEPEFRHGPCGGPATVRIAPARGLEAAAVGVRQAERAWLDGRERGRQRRSASKRTPEKRGAAAAESARKDYRCREKRRLLDVVRARLRRGYKPAAGDKLRRRRRAYEDYLSTFCP